MKKDEKVTIPSILSMKQNGKKIVCLTAYDWLFASILDAAGLDIILVGDSGSMVFAGHKTTLPITMDQMIYHTRAVGRGVEKALLVADMPFMSYQAGIDDAMYNAGRFLKETEAEAVKVEGGEAVAETIQQMVKNGIPVMGHLGLTPQHIHKFGKYRVRGKDSTEAEELIQDAKILEQAGVFSIVLEKIPAELAKKITEHVSVPTIGIGAGTHCDGQILVTHDMLGLYEEFKPKFVRQYAHLAKTIDQAIKKYIEEVQNGDFPSQKESF